MGARHIGQPIQMWKAFDTLFMMVCWLIWKECNARVFNQPYRTTDQIFNGISEEIVIWKDAGIFQMLYRISSRA
uniref:Uncharacterized protein n=1 Tax=Oryza meridionalis TaxID=40149 RepID=A0A0E0F6X1_9ORYZ